MKCNWTGRIPEYHQLTFTSPPLKVSVQVSRPHPAGRQLVDTGRSSSANSPANAKKDNAMAMANRNLKRKATEISEHPLVDAFNFSSSQLHPADFIETEVDLEEETNFNVGEEKNRVYATTGLRCDECDQDIREDSQNLFYYRIFGEHSLRRNHRVLALSCPTHGKVLGFKMKNSWWSLEELLTSRDTKRYVLLCRKYRQKAKLRSALAPVSAFVYII